jgi:hypothetical protein
MPNRRVLFPLLSLAMLLLLPHASRAQQVLYSSFGKDYSVSSISYAGACSGNYSPYCPGSTAAAFTLAVVAPFNRYSFDQIDLAVGTPLTPFVVELAADVGGQPGTVLETWMVPTTSPPVAPLPPPSVGVVLAVKDTLGVELRGGRQYWVIFAPEPVGTDESWFSSGNTTGILDFATDSNTWTPYKCESYPNCAAQAFEVLGTPFSFLANPIGAGYNQIIRLLVAGTGTSAPVGPVEAKLGFTDLNGNAMGPSSEVTVTPGQSAWLDFNANAYVHGIGPRVEVMPVITILPNPNEETPGTIQASVEVFDALLGFGSVFTPVSEYPPAPDSPPLVSQGLAGGQTMRINIGAYPIDPCVAVVSFLGSNGSALASSQQVNLAPGMGTSIDLNADSLNLKLGQRIEVLPVVSLSPPIAGAVAVNPACHESVEVFDHITGRTETYQTGVVQVPAVQ